MRLKLILSLMLGIFLISLVSANNISLFPNNINLANTYVAYEFNFSNSTNCNPSNIILNYSTIIHFNSRGVGFCSIDISNLSSIPLSLCEYRDGSLRKNHSFSDIIFNTIYAKNMNLSGNAIISGNTSSSWFKGLFNWVVGDNWNSFNGSTLLFNSTKLDSVYYSVTQSEIIAGTIDGGNLTDITHPDAKYDGITMNVSETVGSPGIDIRFNFTNVDDFNRGVMRYKTSNLFGDYPIVQMWDYDTSSWEDYPPVGESDSFATMTQPVFDATDHLSGGVAQMRIYKASNGNINNHYYVDWIAIVKGVGVPSGQEIDPFSFHRDENLNNSGYNITTDYFITSSGILLNNNATISRSGVDTKTWLSESGNWITQFG